MTKNTFHNDQKWLGWTRDEDDQNLLHQKFPSFRHHSEHSAINNQWHPIKMAKKYGTECSMIENHSLLISVSEWVSNYRIWLEWGQNDGEKNSRAFALLQKLPHSTLIQVINQHSRMRKISFQHQLLHSEVIQYLNDYRMTK